MADIELVIKLSEDSYKATCNGWMLPSDVENIVQGIKNGTPLPKGHGRLIDADAVLEEPFGSTYKDINIAEIIIEADKEQEDGNDI